MSTTFNLTNTASDVNAALQAVVGADNTPDGASANMVTSQGVYNHIQTELGPFKGKTLTLEGTGIAATDNDTSVPTSAAVKDYVANYGKATMGSLTSVSAGSYTAATDLFVTLTAVFQYLGQGQNQVYNDATITIAGVTFEVSSPHTNRVGTFKTTGSFFVKKGEAYSITLDGTVVGRAATAHQRTFNFTP